MIKTDEKGLWEEVCAAERMREATIKATEDIRRTYQSQYFREGESTGAPSPVNFPYEYISTVTPAIIFDNPKVMVRANASGIDPRILRKLEFGLNQWARQDTLWSDLLLAWIDETMGFGVMHTFLAPAQSRDGERYFKVHSRRLSPNAYFHDSRADRSDEVAFAGHAMVRSKSFLLKNPVYDANVINELPTDNDLQKAGVPDTPANIGAVSRDDVLVYEVWVADAEIPDGYDPGLYHGMIYEMSNGRFIRPPRPYFGPEWGPYTFFAAYPVPRQSYPLCPIGAIWDNVKELNKHTVAVARGADRRKSVVLVDSSAQETAAKIRTVGDGEVQLVDGLKDGKVQQVEFGGVTELGVTHIDRVQSRLDRSAGLSDAARGLVTGRGTATEAADAASQRSAKIDFLAKRFQESTRGVLYTVAWYFWHSKFTRIKLSPEASLELNPRPSLLPPESDAEQIALERGMPIEEVRKSLTWNPVEVLRGGEMLHGNEHEFEDMLLEIDAFSMERANQPLMQKRMTEFMGTLSRIAAIMPQTPWIAWSKVLEDYGDAFNRDMSDYIDPRRLKEMQDAVMAPARQAAQQADAQGQAQQQAAQAESAVVGGDGAAEMLGNLSGQALDVAQGVA